MIELVAAPPAVWPILVFVALLIVRQLRSAKARHMYSAEPPSREVGSDKNLEKDEAPDKLCEDAFTPLLTISNPANAEEKNQMIKDKELYLMLQNVEGYPGQLSYLYHGHALSDLE
jgi:hypothetical protein